MAGILKVDQVQSDSNLAFNIAGSNVAFMNATSLQMVGSNVSLAGTNVITNGKVVSSGMPVGSVLQVVQATTASTYSVTGTTAIATNLTASITPSFSSSKILIISTYSLYCPGTTKAVSFLYRNATNISAAAGGAYLYSGVGSGAQITTGINLLDSPATTSATTYTIYLAGHNSGASVSFNADSQNQQIILMEIAA